MARSFPSFVSRSATKDLLMIGLISQLMGCIYVDRSTTKTHQGVAGLVKDRIVKTARGAAPGERPMLLFPEGTTTNGNFLLPFRKGAFLAGAPVQPVILRYPVNRVSPAWETISGLRHIWLMLCNPVHSVIFYELPVYHPTKAEASNPELYANNVRQYMLRNSHGLEASESSLAEKQILHAHLRGEEPPVSKKRE
ncbi:hypothetical protein WJX73_008706 [Symbiochloris irregularis]|uniref:Phospholipid/glycerol acyltransferase domain-containing protein n=1 Tax=Symbiochloris irregularis TaxID=706552 RepID=A0AAW1NSH7_9CHLO